VLQDKAALAASAPVKAHLLERLNAQARAAGLRHFEWLMVGAADAMREQRRKGEGVRPHFFSSSPPASALPLCSQDIIVAANEFTVENHQCTPSFKLRRSEIRRAYGTALAAVCERFHEAAAPNDGATRVAAPNQA